MDDNQTTYVTKLREKNTLIYKPNTTELVHNLFMIFTDGLDLL
jgi:hypothetical protein